ncbi:hypothetical protein MLD38_000432 [Melastoma candidum]|uniref:Uncharacterized protein n=1 Tax=Melastoma candidum TaxID=119954 RepID=A0ACB9S9U6_9MYRT|nr:hypothetical protein MLD38_000432 [Melastoma candidum]
MDVVSRLLGSLRQCRRVRSLDAGKSLHSLLIKLGLSTEIYLANNLISMYVDCNSLADARRLFDDIPDRNIVTWGSMISAYTNAGMLGSAVEMYHVMSEGERGVAPNLFVYSAVLKACGRLGDIELGQSIHDRICESRMDTDIVLMNTILDMYVKCGSLSDAERVFSGMSVKTHVSWNTILSGYCKEGLLEEAIKVFDLMPERNVVSWNSMIAGLADSGKELALKFVVDMHREGFQLDDFTLPCVLKPCASLGFLDFGKQAHCYIIKSALEYSCFSASALINMYCHCNELDDALVVFNRCNSEISVNDSVSPYNALLSGYVVCGHNVAALSLLHEMYVGGWRMDAYTFGSSLKAFINLVGYGPGVQLHGLTVTSGYELDFIVGSILVEQYAKHGNIEGAYKLFQRLPSKDVVAWSALIMGCATIGQHLLCFSLFRDMVYSDVAVDEFVISSVLDSCSSTVSIRSGRQLHAFSIKCAYELEIVMTTSLIDMYVKCGDVDDALRLFNGALVRDTVCWTGIIVGCGQNGRSRDAIILFDEMISTGLKPNEVTFAGVLAACRHAGLVQEAIRIFKSMESEHGLCPHYEHYYSVVDLLGQAGLFEDALELISTMPFKPDKTIWASLLEACGNHQNAEHVDNITKSILEVSSDDPSVYVMLSNLYATLGWWDKLSKVRESLREVGEKGAGKSWVGFVMEMMTLFEVTQSRIITPCSQSCSYLFMFSNSRCAKFRLTEYAFLQDIGVAVFAIFYGYEHQIAPYEKNRELCNKELHHRYSLGILSWYSQVYFPTRHPWATSVMLMLMVSSFQRSGCPIAST